MDNGILFRCATKEDIPMLLKWRNDPGTRKYSFHSEEVTPEVHESWFNRNIANLSIIELGHIPMGVLRFDEQADHSEVSITIDPERRGFGLGALALKAMSHPKRLIAHIFPENAASIISFIKAGFRIVAIDTIQNKNCLRCER